MTVQRPGVVTLQSNKPFQFRDVWHSSCLPQRTAFSRENTRVLSQQASPKLSQAAGAGSRQACEGSRPGNGMFVHSDGCHEHPETRADLKEDSV
jgi:hypothetical protein